MTSYTSDMEDTNQPLLSTEIETANHLEVIETVISSLQEDQSAMVSHTDNGHLWKFKYGSVEVFVQLSGETDEDTFTVWAIVLKLPVQNEAQLLRKLLEMNWSSTFESRFGILEDQVIVSTTRTVAELSPGEVSRNITVVATIADNNDDALKAEFAAV
jgi:hypothetical protein